MADRDRYDKDVLKQLIRIANALEGIQKLLKADKETEKNTENMKGE